MQSASAEFAAAVESGEQTLARPKVFVDWAADGMGAAGSIDDLSDQVGMPIVVTHKLDDGLPEEVSLTSGLGTSEMEAPLVHGDEDLTATQYFSPFYTDSPIISYPRDGRDLTVDAGLLTDNGDEYLRIFTGRTLDAPVTLTGSSLLGVGRARLKLAKSVQLPPLYGPQDGANATWPVTYAMHQAGIYATQPPEANTILWLPLYGSYMPFTSAWTYNLGRQWSANGARYDPGYYDWQDGQFVDGPTGWLLGANAETNASRYRQLNWPELRPSTNTRLMTQASNGGKVEMWVRGDTAATNAAYVASFGAQDYWVVAQFGISNGGSGTTPVITLGVTNTRQLSMTVFDGFNTVTYTHGSVLPTDGAWHRIGFAWDFSVNRLWFHLDGNVVTRTPAPALQTTRLPASSVTWFAGRPLLHAFLPIADFRVVGGDFLTSTTHTWLPVTPTGTTATVMPSLNNLVAIVEPAPREAWTLIGEYAQADLATFREDELGNVVYLTRPYWQTLPAQTPVATLSTDTNVTDLVVTQDASKIRNEVNVRFTGASRNARGPVWELQEVYVLPPGSTTEIWATFTNPVFFIPNDVANVDPTPGAGFTVIQSTATVNSLPDGTGVYQTTSTNVRVRLTYWDCGAAKVEITNLTGGTTYYLANDENVPTISLVGDSVTLGDVGVQARDAISVVTRGARALDLSVPAMQDRDMAEALAADLVSLLKDPVAVLSGVRIVADPRLQPGDLIEFKDSANTDAFGYWRIMAVTHSIGDGYEQAVTVRRWNGAN